MRVVTYLLLGALFLSGCTTVPKVSRYAPAAEIQRDKIQNYTLGVAKQVYVGEAIVEKGTLTYTEVAEGKFKALQSLSAGAFSITQGQLYPAIFIDQNDGGIYVQGDPGRGVVGAKIDSAGRLLNSNMFYYNMGGWQDNVLTNIAEVGTHIFEPTPTSRRYSPESFKSELLYLGKAGSDIRVSYREYKDDVARPAFYQDLSYDLNSSNVIRYRKFRIKIIGATNEEIEYIVLEH